MEDAGALSYQAIQIDWKGKPKRLFVIVYDKNLGLGGPPDIVAGSPARKRHFETVASVKSGLNIGDVLSLGQDDYPVKDVIASVQGWRHYRAFTSAEQENILTMGMIEKSKKRLGLFRIILLIVSMTIINLVIYTQTLDKIRVIATLKLIGAPDWTIVRLIVEQALLLGFFAYWIGYLMINLTYSYFPRRILLVSSDMKSLFVVVMFICVIASFTGVRSAMKVDPGYALGG